MLLSKTEIISRAAVLQPAAERYRAAGYDLSAGEIIDSDGTLIEKDEYELQPQGIVWIVSKETIKLDERTLAYATIKTGLCNKGVLALNIGIVDPLWEGPLSTAFVNFGKRSVKLKKGDPFLRLSFHSVEAEQGFLPVKKSREAYISDVQGAADKQFGDTFLNISDMLSRHQREAFFQNLGWYSIVLGLAAIVISAILGLVLFLFSEIFDFRDAEVATIPDNSRVVEHLLDQSKISEEALAKQTDELVKLREALVEIECELLAENKGDEASPVELRYANIDQCRAK